MTSAAPFARGVSAAVLTSFLMSSPVLAAPPVDLSKWSPEYVRSIAGTKEFDTAAECGKVTPLDYKGRLTFWYQGVVRGRPAISCANITRTSSQPSGKPIRTSSSRSRRITYNDLLDKFRTALLGNAGPMVVRLQILGGVEFAAKG